MQRDPLDPKGLIREAYCIEGITSGECRSIFLDWALSLADDQDTQAAIGTMLARYAPEHPDHPMTGVLDDGTRTATAPRRRGGWRSRPRDS
ncbi:MAG: hypothetical protein RQ750_09460 [Roseovarius sp.]|nr:hypothetical protein [Roseovarius sp.]